MAINFPNTPGNGSQHTASGITWTYDGTTWKADGITSSYTLPTASSTVLGGVKVGSGLSISSSVLSMTGVQYTDTTALNAVSTSTHHGLFALLNSDGHGYFARGGTVNVAVTVAVDNVNGQATGVFYFDGVEKPALYSINRGVTFIFDQSNASNANYNSQAHPLMFSTGSDGDHNSNGHYMTGVQYKLDGVNKTMAEYVSGFAAATTRTAEFTVASNAPDTLYYWCHSHTGQGNSLQVSQGPWVQLLDKSSSIGELRDVNLSTAPTNGQSLVWDNTNGYWKADTVSGGGGSYANSDVDTHLNTGTATSGQILSWNGSDYDWVADQTGGGGSSLSIQDEGSALSTAATTLNFVGAGVTASGTGAVKTITIAGGGGSGLQSRQTFNAATSAIADGAVGNITITAYKTYSLLKIQTSAAAWVTLYTDQTSRTADAGRSEATDPLPGSGVIAEVITTAAQTQIITPATIGWNNESTPVASVYAKVVNKSGGTTAITVTITVVQLEG